jgi:hypothetical protein
MAQSINPHLNPLTKNIPDWEAEDLVTRKCPLCYSTGEDRFIRPDGLTVKFCPKCGTFFVSPAPSESQLTRFYNSYYSRYRKTNVLSDSAIIKETLMIDPYIDFRNSVLLSFFEKFEGKRMLDVGFGKGHNLVSLKKLGALVSGLDVDKDSIRLAKEKLDLSDVHHCRIEEPLFPLSAIEKASSLLKPGGLLALYTPNGSESDRQEEPICFRVDLEHMQYLTNRSCRYIADHVHLDLVHLEGIGYPLNLSIEKNERKVNFYQSLFSGYSRSIKNIFRSLPAFQQFNRLKRALWPPSEMRLGQYSMFFILRKPGFLQKSHS